MVSNARAGTQYTATVTIMAVPKRGQAAILFTSTAPSSPPAPNPASR